MKISEHVKNFLSLLIKRAKIHVPEGGQGVIIPLLPTYVNGNNTVTHDINFLKINAYFVTCIGTKFVSIKF